MAEQSKRSLRAFILWQKPKSANLTAITLNL
jgi:hypothetical protein